MKLGILSCSSRCYSTRRLKEAALAAVYASPLKRAAQTAEAVAIAQAMPVRFDSDLAEIHHGSWEGMTEAELARLYGPLLTLWRTRPARVQMPEGEHYYDCKRRSLRAVDRIVAAHPGETVAVVTHDVVVKCIIAEVLGLPDDHVTRLHIDNTSINIIEYRGIDALVTRVNDTSHLVGVQS